LKNEQLLLDLKLRSLTC